MKINPAQKKLLVGASALLAVFLVIEIDAEGFEDSHWIIVSLLISALLFLAFSSPSRAEPTDPTAITTEKLGLNKGDEGVGVVKRRFKACRDQWSDFLRSSLVDRRPDLSPRERNELGKFLDVLATKVAFANYLMLISHRTPDALSSDDAQNLRLAAGGILARRLFEIVQEASEFINMPKPDRATSLRMSAKYIAEWEAAVRQCQERGRSGSSAMLDPIFRKISEEGKLNIASEEAREDFFGIKFRQETGRLLADLLES